MFQHMRRNLPATTDTGARIIGALLLPVPASQADRPQEVMIIADQGDEYFSVERLVADDSHPLRWRSLSHQYDLSYEEALQKLLGKAITRQLGALITEAITYKNT